MTIATHRTLAELVSERPARAAVLDRLKLDFCCHGERSLADACAAAGLDAAAAAQQLDEVEDTGGNEWETLGPAELADHIVAVHHRYLDAELPAVDALSEKVLGVHGERQPELARVREIVVALRADLEPHLRKEEMILFPAVQALARGRRDFPFGSIANPISVMFTEHEQAGELLAELREITADYSVPADGCASYRLLYDRLAGIEADTHLHIHKENAVLFPAVMELEKAA